MIVIIIILCVAITCWIIAIIKMKNLLKKEKIVDLSIKESLDLTNLPIITFIIENKKLNFILDTGSDRSYINTSALEGIEYLSTQEKKEVLTADGKMECCSCELEMLYKTNLFIETFYIADMNKSFMKIKEETGAMIHGIIGNMFLIKYKYILDFDNLRVYNMQ